MAIHVREKPPLRQTIDLETPGGRHYRWSLSGPAARDVFSGLRYSDTVPGGFESAECVLPRDPALTYADVARLTNMRVEGPGGELAWEGRLQGAPKSSGAQLAVSPAAVGWQAHLEDDKSARMIYQDIDLSHWGPASTQEKINNPTYSIHDPSVEQDATNGPRLVTGVDGGLENSLIYCPALYNAQGIDIGTVYYEWARQNVSAADANYIWEVRLGAGDTFGGLDLSGDLQAAGPGSGTLTAAGPGRKFALAYLIYPLASDWLIRYAILWRLVVRGLHGLAVRGTGLGAGLLASDVVEHAVRKWAPLLKIERDSIQPSGFVIPHLVFLEPTTAAEIVRGASRFELPDWGVWDDREFRWHQPGSRSRTWRLRTGPSQLEETGETVQRLWESIVVQYQDVDGSTRTVGPPGSGMDTESVDLKDPDPDNPANKRGIVRRDVLVMGVSTAAGAIEVGRRFLELSKLLDTSGKARIVGWVEDDRGVIHPYWAVRSGDYAVFADARDPSPRKIVRTDKDYASRSCSIDLDAPPEGLQQLLERLGVVLVKLGL